MKSEFLELLRPEIFLEISSENKLDVIEEKNKEDGNSLRKVTISGIPEGSVAFSLDKSPTKNLIRKFGKDGCQKLSWLIRDQHDYANKKSDFVIISPLDGIHKILIGELKSTYVKEKDYRFQLVNSMLYVKYILSLMERYHSFDIIPKYRFALLTKKNMNAKWQRRTPAKQSSRLFQEADDPYIRKWKVLYGKVKYEDIC